MRPAIGVVCGIVAALSMAASPAGAQGMPLLKEGKGVWVTLTDGSEQHGSVAAVSSSELVLRIDGAQRSIALAEIRRIEGRDGLGNGLRNGGVVGALSLGGFGVLASYGLCDIPDGCLPQDLLPIALMAGLGAGAGMGAGALIDWAIKGRQLLYASSRTPVVLNVIPTLSAHAFGATASITW